MVLKGYFDGAKTPDKSRITLAAALGTCDQWTPAESAWEEVRRIHNAPPLHTTDAIGLHKDFSAKNGWNNDRVDDFISACIDVIEQHIVIPSSLLVPDSSGRGLQKGISRNGLNIFTFTIPVGDYKKARKIVSGLPANCTEICMTETLGLVFRWGRRLGAEYYELFFDQNEPFYGHFCDRRYNRKPRKEIAPMEKVVHSGQLNSKVSPALQMADLFAWCTNHINDVRRDWHRRLNYLPWDSLILDEKLLLKPIPGALERAEAWNLPKRNKDRWSSGL